MQFQKTFFIIFILILEFILSPKSFSKVIHNEYEFIFKGVEYRSSFLNKAKNIVAHQIRIDLKESDATFFVTPPSDLKVKNSLTETTSNFLKKYKLQIAINGQGFGPPKPLIRNLTTKICGFALSETIEYGRHCKAQYLFVVHKDKTVDIINIDHYHEIKTDLHMAIGGWAHKGHSDLLVHEGMVNPYYNNKILNNLKKARTAIGISSDKQFLYLVVTEEINKGITLLELAQFMQKTGSFHAINLDGGRSSTMVFQDNTRGEPIIVNALSNNFERPVANHLGLYLSNLDCSK